MHLISSVYEVLPLSHGSLPVFQTAFLSIFIVVAEKQVMSLGITENEADVTKTKPESLERHCSAPV